MMKHKVQALSKTGGVMVKLFLLILLLPAAAHATLVQGPGGSYRVIETASGYNVVGLSGQGTTMVRNYGGNSVITAPNGDQTFIHGDAPAAVPIVPVSPGIDVGIPNYFPPVR